MIIRSFPFRLKEGQSLFLIPLGDVHWGCAEHDEGRFLRLIEWATQKKKEGHLLRFTGMGDLMELPSPSERAALVGAKGGFGLHETTLKTFDEFFQSRCDKFLEVIAPIKNDFLGLLRGHHVYQYSPLSDHRGMNTDEYLTQKIGCEYFGLVAYYRLQFPQAKKDIKVIAHHGYGSARTPGAKLSKRNRVLEGFKANIILQGHDDAKLINVTNVLDLDDNGELIAEKVCVAATGSFQKAYLPGDAHGGYAEEQFFSPNDLGVVSFEFKIEKRDGKPRLHWRGSL